MKKLLTKTLATSLLLLGALGTSQAALLVHDTQAEFDLLDYTQGATFDGSVFKSDRDDIANLFDNNTLTMLSLGDGGTLEAKISPTLRSITSGTVIELTGGSTHDESATISLRLDDGMWVVIAELFGNANAGGTSVINLNPTVATVGFSAGSASVFSLEVLSGNFNSILITDTTANIQGSASQDGFDIASFSVTSVSSPATLGLLGLSIAALGFAGRRRK